MKRGKPLRRDPAKAREWQDRSRANLRRSKGPQRSAGATRRRSVSPAATAQRAKVAEALSIVSGQGPCDPAHLWPRSLGGCDDPLCVVPLTRIEHDAYEEGELDLLPYLIRAGCWTEMAHPIAAHQVSPARLLAALTGDRIAADDDDRRER